LDADEVDALKGRETTKRVAKDWTSER